MAMECAECGGTDLVVCATLYLDIGTGADGTHTLGVENVPRDEIDLACRACGSPVTDDEQATYAETARRLITGLLRNGQARPAPGTDAGPCTGCGKPLTWDRSGSRVHDEWGPRHPQGPPDPRGHRIAALPPDAGGGFLHSPPPAPPPSPLQGAEQPSPGPRPPGRGPLPPTPPTFPSDAP